MRHISKTSWLISLILLALVSSSSPARAGDGVVVPASPQGRVSDYAHVLSAAQLASLQAQLESYEKAAQGSGGQAARFPERVGSEQLAAVVLPSLGGEPLEDVSLRFAQGWKIGSKQDDGVLLLIAVAERRIRIEVGYGAEGRLTDALSARIINETIAPRLGRGDYYGGLGAGLAAIHQALTGLSAPGPEPADSEHATRWTWSDIAGMGALLLAVLLLFLLLCFLSLRGGGGVGGFLFGVLVQSLLSGGSRGGGGGFSGGGGKFGGGGASGRF